MMRGSVVTQTDKPIKDGIEKDKSSQKSRTFEFRSMTGIHRQILRFNASRIGEVLPYRID